MSRYLTDDLHKQGSRPDAVDPYDIEPDPENILHKYEEMKGAEDFLYRFLYLQHKRYNVFLRYFTLLDLCYRYYWPLGVPFRSDAKPDYFYELYRVMAPSCMSFEDWERIGRLPPEEIEPATSQLLTELRPRPPTGAKQDVEDVFFFHSLTYVPGLLRSFRPDSPAAHLRLRDPDLVYIFLRGTDPSRPSVQTMLNDMMRGAKAHPDVLGLAHLRKELPPESPERPNLHISHVTVATVAAFVRIWYMFWLPYSRDAGEKQQAEFDNDDDEDREIRNNCHNNSSNVPTAGSL